MRKMSEDRIILDAYLAGLAKMGEDLDNEVKVQKFLSSWHSINIYSTEIFECIHRINSYGSELAFTRFESKKALRSA